MSPPNFSSNLHSPRGGRQFVSPLSSASNQDKHINKKKSHLFSTLPTNIIKSHKVDKKCGSLILKNHKNNVPNNQKSANSSQNYLKTGKENKKAVNDALYTSSIYMSTVSPNKSNIEVPPFDSANIYPPVKTTTYRQ